MQEVEPAERLVARELPQQARPELLAERALREQEPVRVAQEPAALAVLELAVRVVPVALEALAAVVPVGRSLTRFLFGLRGARL